MAKKGNVRDTRPERVVAPAAGPVVVTRAVHFNAAHRLHNPAKPDDWNRKTFGPCNHPNWHGHNYVLEVSVIGTPDPDTGYVIDLGDLRDLLEREIVSKCDHRNLNLDVGFLKGIIPSAENLAIAFWQRIEPHLAPARLHRVCIQETERNRAEYFGPGRPPVI
ncbi:MAG TPA: 6-carboxytetrahydropterin synthase [Opitutaceae bacterium]